MERGNEPVLRQLSVSKTICYVRTLPDGVITWKSGTLRVEKYLTTYILNIFKCSQICVCGIPCVCDAPGVPRHTLMSKKETLPFNCSFFSHSLSSHFLNKSLFVDLKNQLLLIPLFTLVNKNDIIYD